MEERGNPTFKELQKSSRVEIKARIEVSKPFQFKKGLTLADKYDKNWY